MRDKHTRVMAAVFAALLLLIVASSLYGIRRVNLIAENFQRVVSVDNVQAALATGMREAARERLVTLWKMSLTGDAFQREQLYREFFALGSRFLADRDRFLATDMDPLERQLMARLAEASGRAAPIHRRIASQLLVDGQVVPPQQLLENSIPAQQDTLAILHEIVRHQARQTDILVKRAAGDVRLTTLRMFYLLGVVLALGAVLVVLELRHMRVGMARLAQAGEQLASLNRQLERKVEERTRELRNSNRKLQHMASYDPLTDLPNRLLLMEQLKVILNRARRESEVFALLFIDVDDFKCINDSHGHASGDRVLVETAGRIKGQVRAADLVARLAGDEFVVVLVDIAGPGDAQRVADAIGAACNRPVVLEGDGPVAARVSIGIALYPRDAEQVDELLNCADGRMYARKHARKHARHDRTDTADP